METWKEFVGRAETETYNNSRHYHTSCTSNMDDSHSNILILAVWYLHNGKYKMCWFGANYTVFLA